MLLFEHKQHLQSYIAQSLKQTEIFSSTEIAFKDYNKWLIGKLLHEFVTSPNPNIYINPAPRNMRLSLRLKSCPSNHANMCLSNLNNIYFTNKFWT